MGLDIYYYGARYYDDFTGRFMQVDPLRRKHSDWSPYVYGLDSPFKYTDPDGLEEKAALNWMQTKLRGVKAGYWYAPAPNSNNATWRSFKSGEVPGRLWCYQAVWNSYRNVSGDPYKNMPFSRSQGLAWFAGNDNSGPDRRLQTDVSKGERGDVMFMGEPQNMEGHSVLVESVTKNDDGSVAITTIGQFGGYDKDGNPIVSERTFTAKRNKNGKWIMNNGQEFKGYGQIKKKSEDQK